MGNITSIFKKLLWHVRERRLDANNLNNVNEKEVREWLFSVYGSRGFKGYYTIRRKTIERHMCLGLKRNDYWELVGRMKELKAFTRNVGNEFKRRKKEEKNIKKS